MPGHLLTYKCECGFKSTANPGFSEFELGQPRKVWAYDPITKDYIRVEEEIAIEKNMVKMVDPYLENTVEEVPGGKPPWRLLPREVRENELKRTSLLRQDPEKYPMECPVCGNRTMVCYLQGFWD